MAKSSFGAVLRLAVSGSSPVAVANLNSITWPGATRATVDATTHDSPDGAMEFIGDGVFDAGEIGFGGDLILGSAADTMFLAAIESGDVYDFELVGKSASGSAQRSGSGIVTAYTPGAFDVTGKQAFTVTIKVTGKPTQAAV